MKTSKKATRKKWPFFLETHIFLVEITHFIYRSMSFPTHGEGIPLSLAHKVPEIFITMRALDKGDEISHAQPEGLAPILLSLV